jgi:hypothetical protein
MMKDGFYKSNPYHGGSWEPVLIFLTPHLNPLPEGEGVTSRKMVFHPSDVA